LIPAKYTSNLDATKEAYNNEMNKINKEFAKMSVGTMKNSLGSSKAINLIAATGELSWHSNSTIKEEEFDSERDQNDKGSDNSSNKAEYSNPANDPAYYMVQRNTSKEYFNNLLNDEELKKQKRRESYQIPIGVLEDKKIIKSPMKSTSIAFVPKQKDNRTSSMPNIFQPIGSKDKQQTAKLQENTGYYQFGVQPTYPAMMGYGPGMIPGNSSQMSVNNEQFDSKSQTGLNRAGNLMPPIMPDYNYEERRNSGTTGGSSNNKTKNLLADPKSGGVKLKKNSSSQYQNKGRRSSNSSSANLVIPSNDKNVMDYKGQIVAFAKNQQGSKYLQRVLAKASPDVLEFIVIEVGDNLHELMVDSYGNYFCQKLLQSSSSKQRLYLLKKLSPYMIKISWDKRGTHSMQSMIQLINMEEEEQTLEAAIADNVINLSFDPNGTHVLQKVILTVKVEKLDYIFYPCYENLIDLSLDSNGLCVVKKIIARFSCLPEKRELLVSKLSDYWVQLVQSPYGNYAIQQAIDYWTNEELNTIFLNLHSNVLQLSMQKFSSNVIEKCLDRVDDSILLMYASSLSDPETIKSLSKSKHNHFSYYLH